ncbi:hypothetical protein ACIQF6_35945 [Kitasatospora sp. NPDC092948]|uniref:hypothetical protein n=1 Tax=Kitasatospora sp. NPDC092948 TaxID=3364088 RepID=UPI0038090633
MSTAQPLPDAPRTFSESLAAGADPLVVLLARAAEGDASAGRAFLAARAARVRIHERFTERNRASALRMLHTARP